MPLVFLGVCLWLVFGSGSCMPGDREAGTGVLLASPVFLLITLGWQRLLLALWRTSRPELTLRWLPGLCGIWVSVVLGLAAATYLGMGHSSYALEEAFGLALMALALVGGLTLGLTLIVWRVWLWLAPASAFTWAWLPPFVLLVLPAVPMAVGATENGWLEGFMFGPWVLGGFFGLPAAGALLLGLLIEAFVRRARARRATRAASAAGL